MKRLFIALDLPEPVRTRLHERAMGLEAGRAVPAGQLHVTLRFIGPADDETLERLKTQLAKVAVEELALSFGRTDLFPPRSRRPNGIWTRLIDPTGGETGGRLDALRKQVEKAAIFAGIEPDTRPFHPHVTVIRFGRSDRIHRPDSALYEDLPTFMTDSFTLYSSELTPEGAVHTPLLRVTASGTAAAVEAKKS